MSSNQPPNPGPHILRAAHELRNVAAALGAKYLTAHLHAAEGEILALTVEDDVVVLTGGGFEIEVVGAPGKSSSAE